MSTIKGFIVEAWYMACLLPDRAKLPNNFSNSRQADWAYQQWGGVVQGVDLTPSASRSARVSSLLYNAINTQDALLS